MKDNVALVLQESKAPRPAAASVYAASVALTGGATESPSKKPRLTKLWLLCNLSLLALQRAAEMATQRPRVSRMALFTLYRSECLL